MIREVTPDDALEIAGIYNGYVTGSVISFETVPLTCVEMRRRIEEISSAFPYLVYESGGHIAGYCYAHEWKTRSAYGKTLETTVYLSPEYIRGKIGSRLMSCLIDKCREAGYHALIACITAENTASILFHEHLGFRKVSYFRQVGRKFGRWLDVADYELLL